MTMSKKSVASDFDLVHTLEYLRARAYFMESDSYCNFELPPYFCFDEIILSARAILSNKNLKSVCKSASKSDSPYNFEGVNYTLLSNKDGSFGWRQLQLIHPVLYVDLVNTITDKNYWKEVIELFKRREKTCISCISLPLISQSDESNKAISVTRWWDRIEQESLRLALDYRFMFKTDILNCYPSIYTHSLEWAFAKNGRIGVKKDRAKGIIEHNLGTEIDNKIKNMNQQQTNGIPQGSALMDFIAEFVLGGTDIELDMRINLELTDKDFKILRYRDDYRIFSNDYKTGHTIMKILNEVLYSWNLKMNSSKTSESSDIITASVKSEKQEEIYLAPVKQSFQKEIMRIYILSKKYPNAGLIAKNLTDYYDNLNKYKKTIKVDYEVVSAITTMVAFHSPRYIPQAAAILTKTIELSKNTLDRKIIIDKIVKKFRDVPNTAYIDLWLQRITDVKDIESYSFDGSTITKVAIDELDNGALWNSDWLKPEHKKVINTVKISQLAKQIELGEFSPVIERKEFQLYRQTYPEW